MAQLAIKGHATRGREVIEILEMLGGENNRCLYGVTTGLYYYIDYGEIGCCESIPDYYIIFTLEEFLEKFPYKVGDEVVTKEGEHCEITSMQWSSEREEVMYGLSGHDTLIFSATFLQPYTEQNETMEENKYRLDACDDDKLATEVTGSDYKLLALDNYLIGKVTTVENGMIVEYVKKKPQYPKTFVEVLDYWHPNRQLEDDYQRIYKKNLIEKFQDLLYARDAYWKIAGDWKPEFRYGKKKYSIMTKDNKVISATVEETNRVFVFPTEEMRDAFYENFKELINECKELL